MYNYIIYAIKGQKMDELIHLEPRSTFDPMISHWIKEFQDEETSEEDAHTMAIEWFEYNVLGAYMGEHTPIYASKEDLVKYDRCRTSFVFFSEDKF